MSLPPTMRAWTYRSKGPPSKIVKLETGIRTPQPTDLGPDEVLIEVHYVAFNGGATLLMRSSPPRPLAFFLNKKDRVTIVEFEFAGRLIAAGKNVLPGPNGNRTDLRLGEIVIASMSPFKSMRDGSGAMAEYAIAPAAWVIPYQPPGGEKPKLPLVEWAGLGGSGCTAIQTVKRAGLKAGDKVLISGGSGGVGVIMLQMARSVVGPHGRVVTICSTANVELVKSLGADEVIDYRQHSPVHAYLASSEHANRPFDAIIDIVGMQELFIHSPSYLAPGKKFIGIGAMYSELSFTGALKFIGQNLWNRHCPVIFGGIPRDFEFYSAKPEPQSYEILREMVQEGRLKQVLDSTWEFEDVPKAYEIMESRRAKGKVVVHVRD